MRSKRNLPVYFGANVSSDSTDYKNEDAFSGSVDDGTGYSITAALPFKPWSVSPHALAVYERVGP